MFLHGVLWFVSLDEVNPVPPLLCFSLNCPYTPVLFVCLHMERKGIYFSEFLLHDFFFSVWKCFTESSHVDLI